MSEVEMIGNNSSNEMFHANGRILFLTSEPELIRKQLEGQSLLPLPGMGLLDNISTDEIAPNRICLQYTGNETDLLGKNLLIGLREGTVAPGTIQEGRFSVLVAGKSFARGSSRYHGPLALKEAGIEAIIAEPERIFDENAVNAGIYVLPPESEAAQALLLGRSVDISLMRSHLSEVSKDIMSAGSLVDYLKLLEQGEYLYPQPEQIARPMTMIEKMIAKKTHTSNASVGVSYVKPGEEIIAQPDRYYGYELQTTVVRKALTETFGDGTKIRRPEKAVLFNDHTALIQSTPAAQIQQHEQQLFANKHGIVNYENGENGSDAICHTKMLEDYANPGELILGNDSHTCTLGAVNSAAIGKGAADLAGALAFDKMVVKVPETIRVNVVGKLKNGATMKDAVLTLGARENMKKEGLASGRVLEFGGEALDEVPFDEQIKLTNMAVELQAFTGILEPNTQMFAYLNEKRGMTQEEFAKSVVGSDANASYFETITLDLSTIEPTIATPGDTQNGKPLSEITKQNVKIQKAYIGSCTHGTPEDLRQAAGVLKGRKVAEGVKLYVQASSTGNLNASEELGYIQTLLDAGAELLPIGCGACMNAGPGSTEDGEVGIFATNRNYPGRTGKGETYLANPKVVAASAVRGMICGPDDLED